MNIAGYTASILIGISLGLIGGGGSILTVPVLVYLFRIDVVFATVYSLFIVGATSVIGSISYFRKGLVNIKTAVIFGIPSIATVFFTRVYIVPAIPPNILSIGSFTVTKGALLMLLFAVLMILAAYGMIKKSEEEPGISSQRPFNYPQIFAQGVFIGIVTGLIGAGGGFLIIPALVNLLKMPMKAAVGTSLVIIAINSLAGFVFSLYHTRVQWSFLAGIAAVAILGILIGSYISTKIHGRKLKLLFGWFVLIMGIYIITKEIFLN